MTGTDSRAPTLEAPSATSAPRNERRSADGFSVTGNDAWSSLLVLLSSGPAHAFAGKFDAMGVMNEAVQDRADRHAQLRVMPHRRTWRADLPPDV